MKITLNADNEIHRQIANMCVGCEVEYPYSNFEDLLGVYRGKFLLGSYNEDYDDVETSWLKTSIILDLSQVELDLRLAIGTMIEFEGYGRLLSCDNVWGYFSRDFEDNALLRNLRLSTDWLKSVGVEVEE